LYPAASVASFAKFADMAADGVGVADRDAAGRGCVERRARRACCTPRCGLLVCATGWSRRGAGFSTLTGGSGRDSGDCGCGCGCKVCCCCGCCGSCCSCPIACLEIATPIAAAQINSTHRVRAVLALNIASPKPSRPRTRTGAWRLRTRPPAQCAYHSRDTTNRFLAPPMPRASCAHASLCSQEYGES
jgi:hypothetical protein